MNDYTFITLILRDGLSHFHFGSWVRPIMMVYFYQLCLIGSLDLWLVVVFQTFLQAWIEIWIILMRLPKLATINSNFLTHNTINATCFATNCSFLSEMIDFHYFISLKLSKNYYLFNHFRNLIAPIIVIIIMLLWWWWWKKHLHTILIRSVDWFYQNFNITSEYNSHIPFFNSHLYCKTTYSNLFSVVEGFVTL